MAKAKKLPSGQWRTLVFSHFEKVLLPDGSSKDKRVYESFTADTKKESEYLAAEFALTRKKVSISSSTLNECIDKYIDLYSATLSPTTVAGYRTIQKYAFKDILDLPIRKIDNEVLQAAINQECNRPSISTRCKGKPISAKTVNNEFGLISTVLTKYNKSLVIDVRLPESSATVHELSTPDQIFNIVKGTEIELPVLLAMWLSFTMSEIKGLTKSGSVKGNMIYIDQVTVTVGGKEIDKSIAKNKHRNRVLIIPDYVMTLINKVDGDRLVPASGKAISNRFTRLITKNGLPHMSFHDLRHVNASVLSVLHVPDKYIMERGGWSSDKVMKGTYMQTFKPERIAVDNKVDEYFNEVLLGKHDAVLEKKYNCWLYLFDRTDSSESREEFKNFMEMQHEMQHEIKKD